MADLLLAIGRHVAVLAKQEIRWISIIRVIIITIRQLFRHW